MQSTLTPSICSTHKKPFTAWHSTHYVPCILNMTNVSFVFQHFLIQSLQGKGHLHTTTFSIIFLRSCSCCSTLFVLFCSHCNVYLTSWAKYMKVFISCHECCVFIQLFFSIVSLWFLGYMYWPEYGKVILSVPLCKADRLYMV